MTEYHDIWLMADSAEALDALREQYHDMIGPMRGVPAIEGDPEAGPPIEARPAVGDPNKWYACVRAGTAIDAPSGCALADADEAQGVLGKWA